MHKVLFIIYDNESYIHHFPIGIAYLTAVLENDGHEVTIYNQDIYHYTEEHLKEYIEKNNFTVVAIGSVAGYYPYKKISQISEAINSCSNRGDFKYILGGHMVSPDPAYFLMKMKADFCVVGEGEITFSELLKNLEDPYEVLGISFRKGSIIFNNEKRPLIEDLDTLPRPAYHKFPIEIYRLRRMPNSTNTDFTMSVITGRGCKFNCNFCFRLMPGFRLRNIDKVIEEVKFLKEKYGITYIDFEDDLTMDSKERMTEFCNKILQANLNIKWYCEGRLNFVDKEILDLMKIAGCQFINYGIEALDNNVLRIMKKGLNVDLIIKGVELTLEAGITPGLNVMWGSIGDTKETLRKAVDFLKKYDKHTQIRAIRFVTPYPGTELYDIAVKNGLITDTLDFYEKKHINSDLLTANLTGITDEEMYQALYEANLELLEKHTTAKAEDYKKQLKALYIDKDASFRGWRQT